MGETFYFIIIYYFVDSVRPEELIIVNKRLLKPVRNILYS